MYSQAHHSRSQKLSYWLHLSGLVLVQSDQFAGAVEENVVVPLRAAMVSDRSRKAQETAATRVDFYTLVRGEG